MWDRKDLKNLSAENNRLREQAGERAMRAVLAHARVFGKTYEYNIDHMLARAELDVLIDELTYDDLYVASDQLSMGVLKELATYKQQREVYLKGRNALIALFEGDAISRLSPQELIDKSAAYEAERARMDLEEDARQRLSLENRARRRSRGR